MNTSISLFDYKSEFVNRNSEFKWGLKEILIHEHTIDEAWEITQNSILNNHYEDVHCWVFKELTFLELLKTLVNLNLFDFKITKFFNRTGIEFFVSLEAMDLNINKNERIKIQLESIKKVQKELSGIFKHPSLDYSLWKLLNIIRHIKKKYIS